MCFGSSFVFLQVAKAAQRPA